MVFGCWGCGEILSAAPTVSSSDLSQLQPLVNEQACFLMVFVLYVQVPQRVLEYLREEGVNER